MEQITVATRLILVTYGAYDSSTRRSVHSSPRTSTIIIHYGLDIEGKRMDNSVREIRAR